MTPAPYALEVLMRKGLFVALAAWGSGVCAAQPPVDPFEDFREPGEPPPLMRTLSSADELYEELTKPGRCPEQEVRDRAVPCAFLVYPGGKALRPVFKVMGARAIWTFLDTKLAKASIETLWNAADLIDPSGERARYAPVAVVGREENCKEGVLCLEDNFSMFVGKHDILTPACIEEIWNQKSGPTDSGYQSRCRYAAK